MARKRPERVLLIGLDCAAPRFIFGRNGYHLPNLHGLMSRGCWGEIRSCDPPITVPAWACMTAGKDPGSLGCCGFRNRRDYSYSELSIASSRDIKSPRVWDYLSRMGKKVVLVGVPQTYPVQPINGCVLADFLTPGQQSEYAYPPSLKEEIRIKVGEYQLDVPEFRIEDKERLQNDLFALTANRFAVAEYLMEHKPWDFFMMVDMTLDRLHHAFWKYVDPAHPRYVPESPYGEFFRKMYEEIDARVGRLIECAGKEAAVLVVSDHGARPMMGGVCINEWLAREGWLALRERPEGVTRFENCQVDWGKTRAWAAGGYYGRIFINVAGREPQGVVPRDQYEAARDELAAALTKMAGPGGKPLGNLVYKPEDIYARVEGIPPDLLAYFGGLSWRAVGSMGYDGVYTAGNDIGPDDANHDLYGIFIMSECAGRRGELSGLHIMDVAPTVLDLFGAQAPEGMQGKIAGADRQFGK